MIAATIVFVALAVFCFFYSQVLLEAIVTSLMHFDLDGVTGALALLAIFTPFVLILAFGVFLFRYRAKLSHYLFPDSAEQPGQVSTLDLHIVTISALGLLVAAFSIAQLFESAGDFIAYLWANSLPDSVLGVGSPKYSIHIQMSAFHFVGTVLQIGVGFFLVLRARKIGEYIMVRMNGPGT